MKLEQININTRVNQSFLFLNLIKFPWKKKCGMTFKKVSSLDFRIFQIHFSAHWDRIWKWYSNRKCCDVHDLNMLPSSRGGNFFITGRVMFRFRGLCLFPCSPSHQAQSLWNISHESILGETRFPPSPSPLIWASPVAQWQRIHLQGWRHRRLGLDPWVRKIPWRKAWQLTPVFLPGESHGQRSLTGYSL